MRVEDLEVGEIYMCKLTGKSVLIVLTKEQKKQNAEGEVEIIEPAKIGKMVVNSEFDCGYVYSELHDGQLETK